MDNIIKTKNNNQSGVVKVSHEAASYYADLAKKWAAKTDSKVDGSEYSAKYYADKAKSEAESIAETIESANELINGIETTKTEINELKENSITNIQEEKSSAISSIDEAKTTAVNTVEEVKAQATTDLEAEKANAIKAVQGVSNIKIATTEQAGLVKPDGTTISISEDGIITSIGGGSSSGGGLTQDDLAEELKKYAKVDLSNTSIKTVTRKGALGQEDFFTSPVIHIVASNYVEFSDTYRETETARSSSSSTPWCQGFKYYSNGYIEYFGTDDLPANADEKLYVATSRLANSAYKPSDEYTVSSKTSRYMMNAQVTYSLPVDNAEGSSYTWKVDISNVTFCGLTPWKLYFWNNTGTVVRVNWRVFGISGKGAVKYES